MEVLIHSSQLRSQHIDPEYFFTALSHVSAQVRSVAWNVGRDSFQIDFDGCSEDLERLVEDTKRQIGRPVTKNTCRVIYERRAGAPQHS